MYEWVEALRSQFADRKWTEDNFASMKDYCGHMHEQQKATTSTELVAEL
jgi:hypothetical protein